jgi:hypothetical protein
LNFLFIFWWKNAEKNLKVINGRNFRENLGTFERNFGFMTKNYHERIFFLEFFNGPFFFSFKKTFLNKKWCIFEKKFKKNSQFRRHFCLKQRAIFIG